ncbi:MAG: hypothetical protein IH889_04855 [Planctomycetes bacterium]|nr:hypothetical protein [Planctomycetota bacterium]
MRHIVVPALISLLVLAGCQTLGDARAARGTGTTRLFNATEDQVWSVLPKAVNEVDLSIAGTHRADGYLLAERGVTMFSWGEKVAVFVEPQGLTQTEVEVVSMRAVAVNITAAEFGHKLLDMIGRMLFGD